MVPSLISDEEEDSLKCYISHVDESRGFYVSVSQTPHPFDLDSKEKDEIFDLGDTIEQILIEKDSKHLRVTNKLEEIYRLNPNIHKNVSKAALNLLDSKIQNIGILVGGISSVIMWPPTDTDGPGGALALALVLWMAGKNIQIITDGIHHPQIFPALESSHVWNLAKNSQHQQDRDRLKYVELVPLINEGQNGGKRKLKSLFDSLDHIINVGRPGPGLENEYWCKELTSITHWQPDVALLFEWANESATYGRRVYTTAIGEIGNELGMGEIYDTVTNIVDDGKWLACPIKSDFTIVSTVVNWGAWGLSVALAWTINCIKPQKNQKIFDSLLPQIWDQATVIKTLVKEASRCGVTGERSSELLDGFPLDECWEIQKKFNRLARNLFLLQNRSTYFDSHEEESGESVPLLLQPSIARAST